MIRIHKLYQIAVYVRVYLMLRVIISIVVIRYVNDVKGYDRRGAELSNAPLYMKKDTNSITV